MTILKLFNSLIVQLAQVFPVRLFWLQLDPNVHVTEFLHLWIEIASEKDHQSDIGEEPVVEVDTVYAFQELSQCFLCRLASDRFGGGSGSEGLRQLGGCPLLGTSAPTRFREPSGFQCLHKPTRLIWFQVKYSLNRFQIPVEAISQRAHQLANQECGKPPTVPLELMRIFL